MSGFEIPDPILNSPYDEPQEYWYLEEGQPPGNRNCPTLTSSSRGGNIRLSWKAWRVSD